jgi:hypothetical protein
MRPQQLISDVYGFGKVWAWVEQSSAEYGRTSAKAWLQFELSNRSLGKILGFLGFYFRFGFGQVRCILDLSLEFE